jgi:Fic family protein
MAWRNDRDKLKLLAGTDIFRDALAKNRPLTKGEHSQLASFLRVHLTYESNAIECNALTLDETKILLEDGLITGDKPMKDYDEAVGYAEAYDYMLTLARAPERPMAEDDILELHRLFYRRLDDTRAGRYREEQVYISGTSFVPPTPGDVPGEMATFIRWANDRKVALHPVEWAALLHLRFMEIHPFIDGNGRVARLLMNMALIQAGYGIAIIPNALRGEYMQAIRAAQKAQSPTDVLFICFIAECTLETQKDYCRMLRIEPPKIR